ncbi:MAG: alginate export family protein, partial [Myxococcota bacterium]
MLFVWSVALARPQAVDIEAGGEIWTAYELYVAENFGAVEQDDSGALVVRASADLEVHVGPQVIGMVQLKSTAEVGRDGGALPINQNPLDLHQGYLEAWTGDRPTRLEWRVGRQELLYGRGSFVDVRNGLANRRSFDAVRLRAHTPKLLIDAFGALEVSIQPGVFDDGAAPDVPRPRLWGTVAQVFPDRSLGVDVSYAGVSQPGVVYVAGAGDETRHLGNVRGFVRTRHVR